MALFGYDTSGLASARGGLASFYESNKSKIDKSAQMAIGAAETITASMAFGWLGTRYPDVNLLGLDLGFVAGLSLFGLGLMDVVPGYQEHAIALGTGALASYAAAKGASWGVSGRLAANKKTPQTPGTPAAPGGVAAGIPSHYLPAAQPQFSLSPQDLARAAAYR